MSVPLYFLPPLFLSTFYFPLLLQNLYSGFFAFFKHCFGPYGSLNFSDVGFLEKEHANPGLSYAPSYCIWELSSEKVFVERQFLSVFELSNHELFFESFLVNSYA